MPKVKRTHKFDDSNESGNVGHMLMKGIENSHLVNGEVEITEGGGSEDRYQKIDAYINSYVDDSTELKKSSLQIKLDYQHAISGSVALELAEMNFWGGRLCNVKDGNLLQKELMEVDYLVYILPGRGIYFWNPRELNRLTWYLLTNYIQEDEWDEVKNTFRLVVANNQEWLSINYLVPYHMINEPNYYRIKFDWDSKKWDSTIQPLGPKKVIQWNDALGYMQSNNQELYDKMISGVLKYAKFLSLIHL